LSPIGNDLRGILSPFLLVHDSLRLKREARRGRRAESLLKGLPEARSNANSIPGINETARRLNAPSAGPYLQQAATLPKIFIHER
jgi:hypothetical protein